MNILKFVTILCTSYIVVSGAQEFQHSGDKPGPSDRRFHEYIGDYKHLPDERQQPYIKDNLRPPENMELSDYSEQPHERGALHYNDLTVNRSPLKIGNSDGNNRQIGDIEPLNPKRSDYREPNENRPSPGNKILPIQPAPHDYKMIPDNREPLNRRELRDKRKPSDIIGLPDNRETLNDIQPNSYQVNTRGPPNRRKLPDMVIMSNNRRPQDIKNPSGNHNLHGSGRTFSDRGSDIWDIKETRWPPNNNGPSHIKHQTNYVESRHNMKRPLNIPENRAIPENRSPFSDHREPLNDERFNSWDQTGIRRPPDRMEPLNHGGLSDNSNPSNKNGPPDRRDEDTRTYKVFLDNIFLSNSSKHEYDINKVNLTTALEKIINGNKEERGQIYIIDKNPENIKIAKLTQPSMTEVNKSTNVQNANFGSMHSSLDNNTATTSTISSSLQVSAVTPAS